MHFALATSLLTTLVAAQVGVSGAQAPKTSDYTPNQIADGRAWRNVSEIANENMVNVLNQRNSGCTYNNASVRKEWRTLDKDTRKSFTDAVACLQRMAPRRMKDSEKSSYPGVKSRYDEYVATHINYTLNIHDTANFFAWHRTFTYLMEQDLQNLCGYTGSMPYWNWALDAKAPQDSPLFTGDAYSMGSNGKYVAGRKDTWLAAQDVTFPPGTGGGCVTSGPFSTHTIHLGPLDAPNLKNVDTPFQDNPRCLIRDWNPWFSTRYTTFTNLTETVLDNIYIGTLQDRTQGYGGTDKFGLHGGGHWQAGGAGSLMDFHSSPNDPVFWLHHGMIDREWTVWQYLDIYRRQNAISGTSTLGNSPPSAPMTLDDMLPFGFVADPIRFGDVMDTFSGPFCYRYDTEPDK
ncbi:Di-copper centre-containing protein [Piedraia hortae CBS 480.64]|uniref:Di-copper centre-containing protein n=1 Tax=Piedraia hortae CBS 480.64 TaxID=1314780 RepID=A0A6A7C352_9PEZI|nr:Di-copper centre-containing protein [Piedraia hortae CBS 480.64]